MRAIERWSLAVGFTVLLAAPQAWLEFRSDAGAADPPPDLAAIVARAPAGWHDAAPAQVVDPREAAGARLFYDQVAVGQFAQPGAPAVTLVLTWSRDGFRRAGHEQEVCYRAQGFTVAGEQVTRLDAGGAQFPARVFNARRGEVVEDVLYWRVTGGKLDEGGREGVTDQLMLRLHTLRHIFTPGIPANLMVRVSHQRQAAAPPTSANAAFVRAFLGTLGPAGRDLLTGR
ncbi:exosortase C-terminal domain/associated protein EpsI [uncultured Thiodictyon sp.]|uniref:exosortase C-terminal domain/associated protein EpsI n=1 Tax=uncultured Thiodictyon sp. TaxID=1846217 RepID=UPI0025EAA098|nr:exosortase C-terminal domain/associated protein EpsI [uncultured Thiodictyon sp.]